MATRTSKSRSRTKRRAPAKKKRAAKRKPATRKRAAKKKTATKKRTAARKGATKKRAAKKKTTTRRRAPAKKKTAKRRPATRKRAAKKKTTRKRAAKRAAPRTIPSVSPLRGKEISAYVDKFPGWQGDVVIKLDQLVRKAAPDAAAALKWGQPVYELNGPFAHIKAFKNSVNLGFWRGSELSDPKGLLEGTGDKMRHVKLSGPSDIDSKQFADFVKQAVKLNASKGDPTKRK